MIIILQETARRFIIEEFALWAKDYPRSGLHSSEDGVRFYRHLQANKAELLDFRYPGNSKWVIVKEWLVDAGLVAS